ncbi:MAG: hypothetical protein GYA62_13420 [Bacteroidales bacterium]|nr:hypothetical protein [Bacteroidales bacterium]
MIIADQDLVIFGKLFKKGEKITNNFFGIIKTNEEIIAKLKEKDFLFKIINENQKETIDIEEKQVETIEKVEKRGRKPKK